MSASERRYLKYSFFKVTSEWRRLSPADKTKGKHEFIDVLADAMSHLTVRTYSLVGIRGDSDFLLWTISRRLEDHQELVSQLLSTTLGKYLETPYSYLAMTRRSEYLGGRSPPEGDGGQIEKEIANSKYLFVYPFTKKREWYKISYEERRLMMAEHFKLGHKYSSVKIHTAYSFGLDDQEFMLSFETDNPADFLELVMELRGSDASKYTAVETPIFTCVAVQPEKMLDLLG